MVCMGVGSCWLSNPLTRMSQVSAVHQLHMNRDLRVSGFRENCLLRTSEEVSVSVPVRAKNEDDYWRYEEEISGKSGPRSLVAPSSRSFPQSYSVSLSRRGNIKDQERAT
jgi:hypothetical protein